MIQKIILVFILLSPTTLLAADNKVTALTGWVGLWNSEMISWLENRNEINKLCPGSMSDDSQANCKQNNLAPQTWIIPVVKQSSAVSDEIGRIIIKVKPGIPLTASFENTKGIISEFKIDLYGSDWGYGPYFHATYLDKRNDWVKIALGQHAAPGWINPKEAIQQTAFIEVAKNVIYNYADKSIVITEIKGNSVFYRLEQKADMWCYAGEKPKLVKSKITKININNLYDKYMSLKIDVKHKRGC